VELQGEFKKNKLSLFKEESKEAAEQCLTEMGKYFWIYEYIDKLKA